MKFGQAFKMAMKSIMGNKFRSFLTMLGVIIGVSSVIAAVAFAQGTTKNVTDSIEGLGTNLITVSLTGRNSNIDMKYSDFAKFATENPGEISAIAPQTSSSVTVKYGTNTRTTTMVGSTPDLAVIKTLSVQSGRFLLDFDTDYYQKVAIIGTAVVNDIFSGSNPVGKNMKINGQVFQVVGVLTQKDGGQDSSDDDQIIIPVTVAQRMMKQSIIRTFSIQASSGNVVDDLMDKLTTMLTNTYKSSNYFRVVNQAQILSTLNTVTSSMMLILGGIAAISLVVGGIGIMNIMLVSVTERTREIGIRKAIGAKRRSILVQFLIEALMVTGLGGILGVLIGFGIIHFIIGGLNIGPEVYSMTWSVLSFGISLVVGVIFGLFPAYKAANLNPIEALRFE